MKPLYEKDQYIIMNYFATIFPWYTRDDAPADGFWKNCRIRKWFSNKHRCEKYSNSSSYCDKIDISHPGYYTVSCFDNGNKGIFNLIHLFGFADVETKMFLNIQIKNGRIDSTHMISNDNLIKDLVL